MNKFIFALILSIVMIILCAANTKTTVIDTASVDIKDNNYANIDKYVMETLNAYIIHAANIINIKRNKYYVSSVYILNTDNKSFDKKKIKRIIFI